MLFQIENKPLKFYMERCEVKEEIKQMVEERGGIWQNNYDQSAIELATYEPKFRLKNIEKHHSIYSYRFIQDCITHNKLLSLDNYIIEGNIKELELNKTRNPYTNEEEANMRAFVNLNPGNPGTLSYWKTALLKKLKTNHSAESLKHHWIYAICEKERTNIKKERHAKRPIQERENLEIAEKRGVQSEIKPKSKIRYSIDEVTPQKKAINQTNFSEITLKRKRLITDTGDKRLKMSPMSLKTKSSLSMNLFSENSSNKIEDKCLKIPRQKDFQNMMDMRKLFISSQMSYFFTNLVAKCKKLTQIPISDKDVVQALVLFNGRISDTLNYFKSQNNNS